ncbi:MAG: hypothetical protein Fur002_09240 [Anaerolineales bacterium]
MDTFNRSNETMETQEEIEAQKSAQQRESSALADISSGLPEDALFLGMAEDGLPLLLDLYDPVPGAILITGDAGCGKTDFLQMIARAAEQIHPPEKIRFAALTRQPEEWSGVSASSHCVGVYPVEAAGDLLESLVEWAHTNKGGEQCILLMIDDLPALTQLPEPAAQHLRWLLLRGASRRVWAFAALNASRAHALGAWLDLFRSRLFGRMALAEDARFAAGGVESRFDQLRRGQFTMPEGNRWVRFTGA